MTFPYLKINVNFSFQTGLVYIFNLIVGTGALTLPASFLKAGWGLGVGLIVILALVRYANL